MQPSLQNKKIIIRVSADYDCFSSAMMAAFISQQMLHDKDKSMLKGFEHRDRSKRYWSLTGMVVSLYKLEILYLQTQKTNAEDGPITVSLYICHKWSKSDVDTQNL
jgi:hypothetical protein